MTDAARIFCAATVLLVCGVVVGGLAYEHLLGGAPKVVYGTCGAEREQVVVTDASYKAASKVVSQAAGRHHEADKGLLDCLGIGYEGAYVDVEDGTAKVKTFQQQAYFAVGGNTFFATDDFRTCRIVCEDEEEEDVATE